MTLTKAGRSKAAKARKQLTTNEYFFYENAGYSYDPKTESDEAGRLRCAKEMAADEAKVAQLIDGLGWHYEWDWDECPDLSWMSEEEQSEPHEVLCCRLADADDNTLASCCGITDPDSNYRRVMEAELAGEALAAYDAEIENDKGDN